MRWKLRAAALSAATAVLVVVPISGALGPIAHADGMTLGSVAMGSNSLLSAAVYDGTGQLVRHLYELAPRSGTVTLTWDGKDDKGDVLPQGDYNWRAATSSVTGSDEGGVGVGGTPKPGQSLEAVKTPGEASAVAYGPDGDFYVNSSYEELLQDDVFRYSPANLPTGQYTWSPFDGFGLEGHAVAVDSQYVYVGAWADYDSTLSPPDRTHQAVYRLLASTGQNVGWPSLNHVVISNWRTGIGDTPVTGIAVDNNYLWVLDGQDNQIKVFDKNSGLPAAILGGQNAMSLAGTPVSDPRAIVTDGANNFWITGANGVASYSYSPTTQSLQLTTQLALGHPYGLAWDRSNGGSNLYVSEIDTGKIHKYAVVGTILVEQPGWPKFGSMPPGGAVTDTTFGWKYDSESKVPGGDAAIAVSPDGRTLSVVDEWNGRTMFYDTSTGQPLSYRLQGQSVPTLDVNPTNDPTTGAPSDVISMGREYQVDYGTRDANGQHPWKLVANWSPPDIQDFSVNPTLDGEALRRLPNGQEYAYVFVAEHCNPQTYYNNQPCDNPNPGPLPWGGILIYKVTDQGMQRVAEIKRDTPTGGPSANAFYTGTTTLEFDSNTSSTNNNSTTYNGYFPGSPGSWVDANGTIWLANATTLDPHADATTDGAATIPLTGFDSNGTPLYNVNSMTIQTKTEGDRAQNAYYPAGVEVRFDSTNNRVFTTATNGLDKGVMVQDLKTGQRSVFSGYSPLDGPRAHLRDTVGGLAVDNSPQGFFYTGSDVGAGHRITMYTWDGLAVGRADNTNLPYLTNAEFDRGSSLAVAVGTDGTRWVYAEDDGFARDNLYSFAGANSVARAGSDPTTRGATGGNFHWPGTSTSNDLVAWWRFDAAAGPLVQDSSGNDHYGVLQGPAASWHPADGVDNGSITFGANNTLGIHFRKDTTSQTNTDNLIDNTAYLTSGLSFASWIRTTGDGVVIGYQNTWTQTGTPTQAVPLAYVDTSGHLRAGTATSAGCAKPQVVSTAKVNDGQWHQVTLAASSSGQTLYIDGTQVDSTTCGMVATGALGFTSLATGYTSINSTTAWPGTPGGYFPYVGSLDDTRIYGKTLTASDVQTLATPPAPAGPLASYPLNQGSGTAAPDVTDHGKDATIIDGTWAGVGPHGPLGGGSLAFNGTSTRIPLPMDTAIYAPMSFTAWAKTTSGGPIFGDQRGVYPAPEISPCSICGVGPVASQELTINPDGTVSSELLNVPLRSYLSSAPHGTAIPPVNDGQWHYIAVTVTADNATSPRGFDTPDSFTATLYIDGAQADQAVNSPQGIWSFLRYDGQLGAGHVGNGPWQFYNGQLADVEVYSRALTADEVGGFAHG